MRDDRGRAFPGVPRVRAARPRASTSVVMTRVLIVVLIAGLALVPMGGVTLTTLVVVGLVMLGLVMVAFWLQRRRAGRACEHGCRVCGYGLEGLGVEGDGCVVCPECGAAWRRVENG